LFGANIVFGRHGNLVGLTNAELTGMRDLDGKTEVYMISDDNYHHTLLLTFELEPQDTTDRPFFVFIAGSRPGDRTCHRQGLEQG